MKTACFPTWYHAYSFTGRRTVRCILQPQGNFESLKLVKITGGTEVTNYMY